MTTWSFPVDRLPSGPVDIIGDVHGQLDALDRLLDRMGYTDGRHPGGRSLVFVGDLVDRGPHSVGVLERVMPWVEAGDAFCVLGNHELNLMLDEERTENGWWFGSADDDRTATEDLRRRARAFFASLPLVLERDDLRVVHAAWSQDAVVRLRSLGSASDLPEFHSEAKAQLTEAKKRDEALGKEEEEFPNLASYLLPEEPRRLPRHGWWAEKEQQRLPHKLLTSGPERALAPEERPFDAGGSWRMAVRDRWWERYDEEKVVVVGHYWRTWRNARSSSPSSSDFWRGDDQTRWLGKRHNVYCVDFSVGRRSAAGEDPRYRLAALRWEDGAGRLANDLDDHELPIGEPGRG